MPQLRLQVLGSCEIIIGDEIVSANSPLLFALLLLLAYANERGQSKSSLIELLHQRGKGEGASAHSLRQLLYRLRKLGAPLEAESNWIRLDNATLNFDIEAFASLSPRERLRIPTSRLVVLPDYEPRISPQFTDWLESLRGRLSARVASVLRTDFDTFRRQCEWTNAVATGESLRALGMLSEEMAGGLAESLAMLGRKQEALNWLDAFLLDCDTAGVAALRQLRTRIARLDDRLHVRESSFVGRQDVMQALAQQWLAASTGHCETAIILGQPGIGKTRLGNEFGGYVTMHGGNYLLYRCELSDVKRPHSLFKQLLPHLQSLRGSLGASPALRPYLDRLALSTPGSALLEPAAMESTRGELHGAIIDLLDAVSSEKPLVIAVDDAHLLDPASLAVLEEIAQRKHRMALMLVGMTRSAEVATLASLTAHSFTHALHPLTPDESRSVLHQLLPRHIASDDFLDTCCERAQGNPYYLHAIAFSSLSSQGDSSTLFDIRVFAARAYFQLSPNDRTLFEASLFLGRYASLARVREITAIDGLELLTSLRLLESNGMLSYHDGHLRCTHALLEEACIALIPSAIAAALNERIARCLETECEASAYSTPLAWAAAECWLASGNTNAAVLLLRHCASQAAALGEPQLAASTLRHIPLARLTLGDRVSLLSAIAEYEEAAAEREKLCETLHDLLAASVEVGSPREAIRELEFRVLEADLFLASSSDNAIAALHSFLLDNSASAPVRCRAGIRLLIAADANLDRALGTSTYQFLTSVLCVIPDTDPLRLRAELIFNTVFGDRHAAAEIARAIVRSNPIPTLTQSAVGARRNAAFALLKLGLREEARTILTANYRFMLSHHVSSEAAYSLLLLADLALSEGDAAAATRWLNEVTPLVNDSPLTQSLQAGYCSAVATLALLEGRHADAKRAIEDARIRCQPVSPRYRALDLSLELRVRCAEGSCGEDDPSLIELDRLYSLGRDLGGQDSIVEALCAANPSRSRSLLDEYLSIHRRELGEPEASLIAATGHVTDVTHSRPQRPIMRERLG
jgi:DNA-binding SARP family transcriptional activator